MDHLPVEILCWICSSICVRKDVLNFRLVCTTFAAIGAQYMLPQVPVAFLPQSFVRLEAISEHPVISRYVTTIIYQADVLPKIKSFEEYRSRACVPRQLIAPHPSPQPEIYEQIRQSYRQNRIKFKNDSVQLLEEQIEEGWKLYQSVYEDQMSWLGSPRTDIACFRRAMAKFPRLTKLRMQTRHTYNEAGMYLIENPYKDSLVGVVLPDHNNDPCGSGPLLSLLVGALVSRTPFRELSAGLLSWRFFSYPDNYFEVLKRCVRHLRKIDMEISFCNFERPAAEEDAGWRACIEWFLTGRVREFVAAAPDLEVIVLLFDSLHDFQYAIDLGNVLGNKTWPNLRLLNLRAIITQEDDLLSVFKRHAATLKVLVLGDINLCGPNCSWMTVFLQIPEILDLRDAECHGNFASMPLMRLIRFIKMDDIYQGGKSRGTFNGAVKRVLCRFIIVADRVRLKLDLDEDIVAERKLCLREIFGEDEALD